MISAKEAKFEAEEYLKGRVKINEALDRIDGIIRGACHKGKRHVRWYIKENTFYGLSVDQMKVVINELEDLGYKITPIFEEHDKIQITNRVGYNIEW